MAARHAGWPIVAGIDGSACSLKAVRWAAAEAVRRNVVLRVVTAFAWNEGHPLGEVGLGVDYQQILLKEARRQLDEAMAVAGETEGVRAEPQLIVGFPVPVLRAVSRRAQLVVLGDRGHGGVSGLLVGSVAIGTASRAACPVVLVRDDDSPADDRTRPVVVGVDGSPLSEAALAFAFEAAAMRGVPLVAVHTYWDLIFDPAVAGLLDWEAIERDEQLVLAERLAGWGEKYPDVQVERRVVRDRPAAALVAESERAQLVVVGSRGRGSFAGLLLGSVSHAMLHKAACSVAIVRPLDDTN